MELEDHLLPLRVRNNIDVFSSPAVSIPRTKRRFVTYPTPCPRQFDSPQNTSSLAWKAHASRGSRSHHTSICIHHLSCRPAHPRKEDKLRDVHLAFCTRATRLRLAREPMFLFTPPLRRPDIWTMSWVGTISWFFEPISTWGRTYGNVQRSRGVDLRP